VSQNHCPEPNRHCFAFLHPIYCARSHTKHHWRYSKLDISCTAAALNSRQWVPFFQSKKKNKTNKSRHSNNTYLHMVGSLLLLGWVMISCHANSLMLSLATSLSSLFLFLGLLFSYNWIVCDASTSTMVKLMLK
jgi:protein-S-isoprenylcysteine O-methyltransferase Ste14